MIALVLTSYSVYWKWDISDSWGDLMVTKSTELSGVLNLELSDNTAVCYPSDTMRNPNLSTSHRQRRNCRNYRLAQGIPWFLAFWYVGFLQHSTGPNKISKWWDPWWSSGLDPHAPNAVNLGLILGQRARAHMPQLQPGATTCV